MKTKTATTWANRTKEAAASISAEELGNLRPVGKTAAYEEISTYYQYNAPKTDDGRSRQLSVGQKIYGTYLGTFTTKGKFPKQLHKVSTAEGVVAVTGCGQLNKLMAQVGSGSKVLIQYRGKTPIKSGQFEGNLAHAFDVSAA